MMQIHGNISFSGEPGISVNDMNKFTQSNFNSSHTMSLSDVIWVKG